MVDRLNSLESATYRSREVAEVTGVTLRQLQWWDEQGLVSPMQTGHCRLYTGFEVQQVVLIKSLRNKGMSLRKIRPWLEQLSPRQVADALSLNRRGKDVYLLTDGERVYLEGTPERVIRRIGDSELPLPGATADRWRGRGASSRSEPQRVSALPARLGADDYGRTIETEARP